MDGLQHFLYCGCCICKVLICHLHHIFSHGTISPPFSCLLLFGFIFLISSTYTNLQFMLHNLHYLSIFVLLLGTRASFLALPSSIQSFLNEACN